MHGVLLEFIRRKLKRQDEERRTKTVATEGELSRPTRMERKPPIHEDSSQKQSGKTLLVPYS